MKNKPVCSVIIPVYNGAKYIEAAIRSAMNQTERNLQILVIDDCSTDNTAAIVKKLAEEDDRVGYFKLAVNMGVAAARNTGAELAVGEWIGLLDADDIWDPGKLARQLAFQHTSGAEFLYTGAECIDENGQPNGRYFFVPEQIDYQTLLKGNDIVCSSVLIKKELFSRYPMQHADAHEDYLTWLQIMRDGLTACGLNEPLIQYRITASSKSGNKWHSAAMTWKTYGYMDLPFLTKCRCFISYAGHGLKRYHQ